MMLAVPATILTAAVTILSIFVCFYTAIGVARARAKHGVLAPAMSGHPLFERALRVQMNTLEQFVMFLPALWLATLYFHTLGWLPPAMGLLWCVGRLIFAVGYMADPDKRHIGFGITLLSTAVLIVLAVIGLVGAWSAATAI